MAKMKEQQVVSMDLTKPQLNKLKKGGAIIIKPHQIGTGPHQIALKYMKHRKLMKAKEKSKGFKLALDEEEGSGFFGNVWKGIKHIYQEAKPAIRKGLTNLAKQAVSKGVPALAGAVLGPEAIPAAAVAGNYLANRAVAPAVNAIGNATGAYGIRMKGAYGMRHPFRLENNHNTFINTQHPAMNPLLPPHDQSYHGGSFKTTGGSFMPTGSGMTHGVLGSPMMPILPQGDFSRIRPRF